MSGDDLRRRRLELGLSREELADVFRVDPRTLRRWECEKTAISAPGAVELALERLEERARIKEAPAA